jgi:chromosome segregation ATPase
MSDAGKVSLPTPKRIEEIKRENEELVKTLIRVPIPSLICASGQITELLAALEETQQRNVSLNEESLENFREAAKRGKALAEAQKNYKYAAEASEMVNTALSHVAEERNTLRQEMAEAQQTIARQREALTRINDLHVRGIEDKVCEPFRQIASESLKWSDKS